MFGPRRRLRSLTAIVLALWLLVLGTGAVHGCVIGHELHTGAASAAATPCAEPQAQHDEARAAGHGAATGLPHAGTLPCEKFCDGEAAGMPTASAQAQQAQPAAVIWLAPPPAHALAVLALAAPVAARQPGPALARARVPIPIAFLRLTL